MHRKMQNKMEKVYYPGADPGFQVRGGGEGALEKNCVERREARNFLGYFV